MRRALLSRQETVTVFCCVVCFVLLTVDVAGGGLATYLDRQLRDWIDPPLPLAAAIRTWGRHLGEIGASGALLGVAMLVATHLTWRLWPLLLAVGNAVTMLAVVLALKSLVNREGPRGPGDAAGHLGYYPSGHTATAAVCVGTIAYIAAAILRRPRRWPAERVGVVVGLAVGAAVGTGTVIRDHHWVSDVVGSLLLSTIILTVGFALCRPYVVRREGAKPPHSLPAEAD